MASEGPPPRPDQGFEVFLGMVMAGGVMALVALICGIAITVTPEVGFVMLGASPFLQLGVSLPLAFHLRKQGATGKAQGMLIGAGIIALLSTACYGFFLFGLTGESFH